MYGTTSHPTPPWRKGTNTKSTNNDQNLVTGSSKCHTCPYRKIYDQDNYIFYLGWKQRGLMKLYYTAEIRVSNIKMGSPNMENKTRETLKTPRLLTLGHSILTQLPTFD